MTKRRLYFWVRATLASYVLAIVTAVVLRVRFPDSTSPVYGTFKDLIPFLIAIPTTWLGYCFSRRIAYLQHLRGLWSEINSAIQQCIQYTHGVAPCQTDYAQVLLAMSTVIDEIRGAFKNIGERPSVRGLYPFEEIKQIHTSLSQLGFGETFSQERAKLARQQVLAQWKRVQEPFLSEFDRAEPSYVQRKPQA